MVTALVLLKVKRGRINNVGEKLAAMEGITDVFSVGGRYDLVAIIKVKDNESMAELVTEKMLHLKGIIDSETLIAFRAYARDEMESMFSIGME